MNEHGFKCSDTPGVFECPAPQCRAYAHYERDEERYCVHPDDQDELAVLHGGWDTVPESVHALG